jgi:PAS domain S-box-containing protein
MRGFLIGKQHIESRLEYKSAMLRGYMALLAVLVGFSYGTIDLVKAIWQNYPYYIAVIIFGAITIILNRKGKFQASTILFLITMNSIIFLFSSRDLYRTGTYMFFICISLSAFSLFGIKRIRLAILFTAISLILFLVSYLGDLSFLRLGEFDETYITVNFVINFLTALTTAVLIVYFLIGINYRSEQDLIRTSEELKESRKRNQMVVEAANAGIYEWLPSEQKVFVSTAWKRLLGYSDDELNDFRIEFYYSILHPDDHQHTLENIQRHFQDKKPYFSELRLRTKSGEYRWFMDSGLSRFDGDGKPVITVGSIIDINERKLAEEKIIKQNELLAKANKELDQFVYSVSHDLRAPLSSILGLTNVYGISDDLEEKNKIVTLISERANTLDAFIREILAYSRNSRTELNIQKVNVLEVVNEVINGLAYMQGFDRMWIRKNISPDLHIITDRERLKVILSNLIANAVKYSDVNKDSFIDITTATDKSTLTIDVEDNGVGIAMEHTGRIFEMFYQAHESAQGSGLGLYIVGETAQKLRGTVSVRSEYAVGSVFTLKVPLSIAS